MNIRRLRHLTAISFAILVFNQSYPVLENGVRASIQNELSWVTYVPEDEEFTATIPAWPTVKAYPISHDYGSKGERILKHREYSGYGSGLIFIIESFKAERPQKLTEQLLQLTRNQNVIFERDIAFDGGIARLYRSPYSTSYATYTRHIVRFVTRAHVYLVTLATVEETNAAVDRFLSSFRLRRSEEGITQLESSGGDIPSQAFAASEVTRRAIVVWKSAPFYTDEARAHMVVGTVTLTAVLTENGYVSNITVTKGLKDGLTDSAIEAARNIRFFPAEKDGKRVSQRIALEYNFNLY